ATVGRTVYPRGACKIYTRQQDLVVGGTHSKCANESAPFLLVGANGANKGSAQVIPRAASVGGFQDSCSEVRVCVEVFFASSHVHRSVIGRVDSNGTNCQRDLGVCQWRPRS